MFSFGSFEKFENFAEVFFFVAGGVEGFAPGDFFFSVVEAHQYEGDVCPEGDVVETRFEFIHFAAGAFGCNGEYELGFAFDDFHYGIHIAESAAAVYGVAAEGAEDGSEGRLKEGVFGNEFDVARFEGAAHQQAEGEVPVGGVRHDDDDEFVQFMGVSAGNFPTEQAQDGFADDT